MVRLKMLVAALFGLACMAATPAAAQTTMFTFISSAFNLRFTLPQSPVPILATQSQGFTVRGTGTLNNVATTFDGIDFANSTNPLAGGGFAYDGTLSTYFYGAQVYTGSETAPTFVDGVYNLTRYGDGSSGVLIVSTSAAPDAGSWAMMIGGLGVAGAAMRARRRRRLAY